MIAGFSMFASRTNWSLAPNRLSQQLEQFRRQRLAILDLTESNPTHCGFTFNSQEILRALADPGSLAYEPDPRGLLSARLAVANYYAAHGVMLNPDQIFLTTGSSEAYSYVFRLLANPGDHLLVPRPSYPLLDFLARLNDVELTPYPLIYDQGWQIDQEAFRTRLSPRTKAILVVHPNNPTGSFVGHEELEFLLRYCQEGSRAQPLALIADEVFADYAFAPQTQERRAPQEGLSPALEGAALDGAAKARRRVTTHAGVLEALTFTLSGLSKISALPQMKLAWVVVNGPTDYLRSALERLEVISDTYLSVSAPLAHALPKFLEARHSLQPQILERIMRNLTWLNQQLSPDLPVSCLESEAGWYAILKLPAILSDEDWAIELLRQDGVLVHPGHFYDFPGEGHLIISLLPIPEIFQQAICKLLTRVVVVTEQGARQKSDR